MSRPSPIVSLIQSGTKLWLDSIDPDLVRTNRELGATGATSNPVIVSGLIETGRFDDRLNELSTHGLDDSQIAWEVTNQLVTEAQEVFYDIWQSTQGNDGYVSFELDPLLEDPDNGLSHEQRVEQYIELGKKWSEGHDNRMIKVPATPAGIESLEELAASGVTLNVTLIFSERQYRAARESIWRGAQRRTSYDRFKSVYSIFVSRVDVYTSQHAATLSDEAQGLVGIVNAKRIWAENQEFWADKNLPLDQELIFASTGVKDPSKDPTLYIKALAGSDIQTNPPSTNDAVEASGMQFSRQIESLPPAAVLEEIDQKVNFEHMEATLMEEGIKKFASPQKAFLELISKKRSAFVG